MRAVVRQPPPDPANHSGKHATAYYANTPAAASNYTDKGHDLGFNRYVMKPGFRKAFKDLDFKLESTEDFVGDAEWRIPAARYGEFNSFIDHSRTQWWEAAQGYASSGNEHGKRDWK